MRTFTEFLADRLAGRRWCVAVRMTPRLRRNGYEVAIPPKRYADLEIEWQRETYGAPLQSLRDAAPDMLKMLRWAKDKIPREHWNSVGYAALIETIWVAEGCPSYADRATAAA